MPVYPGDRLPEIRCITEIASAGVTNHQITTGMHVGTHMDAPLHMIEGGLYLSEIEPQKFFGRGVLLDARGRKSIDQDILRGKTLQPGDIVLLMTGLSDGFKEPEYYSSYPEITPKLGHALAEAGISILGMDTPSPDRPPFPVHKILLRNQVLIIENLTNLKSLVGSTEFEVIALPAKFHADAAPTRVVARITGG